MCSDWHYFSISEPFSAPIEETNLIFSISIITVSIPCHWSEEKNLSISVISVSVMIVSLFHTDVGM